MTLIYSNWLVVLSVVVAILVSYTSLRLASRVAESSGAASRAWLYLGAVSMGIGIWSMHFIGMMALSLPIQLQYSISTTLVSLGVAIVTSGFAIRIASSPRLGTARHLTCSVVMGAGIAAMHYTGMHAIMISPGITYAFAPALASVLIAVAASYFALWLTFTLRRIEHRHVRLARLAAAVVMGCAIAGMHYTGMEAAIIQPGAYCSGGLSFDNRWLAMAVAVASMGILAITLLTSVFDTHMAARARAYADNLARADQLLVHQATHDSLTGLPNRGHFLDRLRDAVERVRNGEQRVFAVLFLDFDRFKFVNDTLGHDAGDELLRQIALRLAGELRGSPEPGGARPGDVISRFGGDEFLLLLNGLRSPADAPRVANRILQTLSSAYGIRGRDVHCSASIGIVTSEHCASSAEDIIRNADVAMYEAKRAGRACVVVFNEAMHTRIARQVLIESSLRKAIGTAEMSVVYQPIIDLTTGQMVSVEALVRWRHPMLGQLAPSEFIPIAEESGVIIELGKWVRMEACRTMRHWRERDPQHAPWTVSVNLSRVELAHDQGLPEQIRQMLQRVGLPPQCLQLEVTEREVMRDPEGALALMTELRALGVRLAMDDFGTGTSSLGILRTYPFDTIKIDRSFVKGLVGGADVLAVLHATIRLVENLGMSSLVEGIEEEEQLAMLVSLGCRYGQGYLFSKPIPAEQVLRAIGPNGTSRHAPGRSGLDPALDLGQTLAWSAGA
jgi:diguanylate cyclase